MTMTMSAIILMGETSDLLSLTHWLSPVFPVGGYAYSQGIEQAITAGAISNGRTLYDWLRTSLVDGTGQADAIFLISSMKADADHNSLNMWAKALAASSERWQETSQQGAAFTRATGVW